MAFLSALLWLAAADVPDLPYVGQNGSSLVLKSGAGGAIYANDLDLVRPPTPPPALTCVCAHAFGQPTFQDLLMSPSPSRPVSSSRRRAMRPGSREMSRASSAQFGKVPGPGHTQFGLSQDNHAVLKPVGD